MTSTSQHNRYVERLEELQVIPTPLYAPTFKACQTNVWTNWLGFTVPASYTSIEDELVAIHQSAGLEDVSPHGKYLITGPHAATYIDHLVIADCHDMGLGGCIRSPFCHANGKVINIADIARIGEQAWWIAVPGRHSHWLHEAAIGFDVSIEDQTEGFAGLRLFGPRASEVFDTAGLGVLNKLQSGEARRFAMKDLTLVVTNPSWCPGTDLTIWCSSEKAGAFWKRLQDMGEPLGLRPVGFDAAHAHRVELGIPSAGYEFVPAPEAADASQRRTAIELGYESLLDFEKSIFNGRSALLEEQRRKKSLVLVHMAFPDKAPPAGMHIYKAGAAGKPIGLITSSADLPHLAASQAIGFVAPDCEEKGASVTVRFSGQRELVKTEVTLDGRIIRPIRFSEMA